MTLFVVGVIGIMYLVAIAMIIFAIGCIIFGIIIFKKNKIASIGLFGISAIIILILGLVWFLVIGPKYVEVETPSGDVKILDKTIETYLDNVANDEYDEVEQMLEEEPALVYVCDDYGEDILQKSALNGNLEMMKLAMEYGAEFDSEIIFDMSSYDCSLHAFLDEIGRRAKRYDFTDKDVYEIVEFMVENGASIEVDEEDATDVLFYADGWICYDKIISDEDIAIVELLHSYGAEYSYEVYFDYVTTIEREKVEKGDNYEKLLELIQGD